MRHTLSFLLFMVAGTCWSQDYKTYDFSRIDPATLNRNSISNQIDSVLRNSAYDSLNQLYYYSKRKKRDERAYGAFGIGYQALFSSISNLNNGLAALGLPMLPEQFGGVPIAMEIRGKKWLFIYQFAPDIKNKVSNKDYSIDAGRTNFSLGAGYDLLNSSRFHLYPQLTLDWQQFRLNVRRNASSFDVTDVNGLVTNPAGTYLSKEAFTLTYSGEIDWRVLVAEHSGLMLGIRYGYILPISEGKFKVNDVNSAFISPGDKLWTSFYSVVVKIYFHNY